MGDYQIDALANERLEFLNRNYEPLVNFHLLGEDKIYLGTLESRICRFCGKQSPDVSFENIAHALPEFIGNRILFSYYECDTCNSKYSGLLESHMANYMNLYHTISQIKGKKKIPSHITTKQKSRIDIADTVIISEHEGDEIVTIDDENNILTIKSKRASYIPIAVYKCLIKMALTIMPENELVNFSRTIDWINEPDHNSSTYTFQSLPILFSIASGQHPFNFISCSLFKRRASHHENVPHVIFLLAYSNYVFQVFLPLSEQDIPKIKEPFIMKYLVTPVDMMQGSGALRRLKLDFIGKKLVKGEEASITMSFSRMQES